MKKTARRLISYLLITAMVFGFFPWMDTASTAYAAGESATNSSTAVDLDELMATISDEEAAIDTDGDGLCDQLERILGTDPDVYDTDEDGLDDRFEAENGLDPLKYDTNDDGLNDLVELTGGSDDIAYEDLDPSADADGDGIPNVMDADNDNDGAGDAADISPFTATSAAESQTITVTTTGKATFVKIQLSPADAESLYENNQIMNWPQDVQGQICDFDGSKEDLTIIPMLEVTMNDYPDEDTCEEYGYVLMDGYMLVPLQQLEDETGLVGLAATIYLPENTGTATEDGKYKVTMTIQLSWSLSMTNDNIAQEWAQYGMVRYNGKDVTLEQIDADDDTAYLGCDVGYLNNNKIPDFAVFWEHTRTLSNGSTYSSVYSRYYYDLVYNANDSAYDATSVSSKMTIGGLDGYPNKKDSTHIYGGRLNLSIENGQVCASGYYDDYSGNNTNEAKPIFNYYTYRQMKSVRGDPWLGAIPVGTDSFYYDSSSNYFSYVRDSYYKYDKSTDTVWYLYETYDKDSGKDQLVMKRSYKSGSEYTVETQVLQENLPVDKESNALYRHFRDLAQSLSVNIYDFNGDGKDDLLITDRSGGMYIYTDCNTSGWQNRKYRIPDTRAKSGVEGKNTRLFDFDGNGTMDLVGAEAIRSDDYDTADLTFQLSIKNSIAQGTKIISSEYEAFKITGLQIEEADGTDTATVYGGTTPDMLNMSATLEYTYLQGDMSIDETIADYLDNVLGGSSGITAIDGSYNHIYSAVMDISENIVADIAADYSTPKPVVILTEEKNRLLNMDDLDDADFGGDGINLDISGEDIVTKRQMMVKWAQDGNMLSQYEINDMVDNNTLHIRDFEENTDDVKESLAQWNLGEIRITGIGVEFRETISRDMKVSFYDTAKKPGQAFTLVKTLFVSKPIETVGNVGWQFESQLARYNSFSRIGKVMTGIGVILDVACAIHSGVLYGRAMAEVGGTTFGVVTGLTYGTLLFSVSALSCALVFAGPVGWAVVALIAVDGILAFMFDGYDSIIAKAINAVMNLMYSCKQYPGTEIYRVEQTDDEETNQVITSGMETGYSLGAEMETLSEYICGVRAASTDTPANTSIHVGECYAILSMWNQSNAVTTTNEDSTKPQSDVYILDGIWYNDRTRYFDNTLIFDSPGMNLQVNSYSNLKYRLIEKVTEERILWHTSYDYDYDEGNIASQSASYYDVIPNNMDIFWTSFNFLTTDTEPNVRLNQIAQLDADGDGLKICGSYEMDDDGNIVYSSPNDRDTDDDGLNDKLEVAYGTDPSDPDCDGDGLNDYEEVLLGTDPNNADTDGDGVTDGTEVKTPVSITITPDGGTGSVSALGYSDPLLADTDGDGLDDKYERDHGLNPASKYTNGQVRWDGNANDPSMIQDLPDFGVQNEGETVALDLNDYFQDNDGDDLFFEASIGEINEDEIWSYTFSLDDSYTVDVEIEANDLKGGTFSDSFVVYDSAAPVVVGVTASTGGKTLKGKSTADFGEGVYAETTFTLEFNETAFIASPSSPILDGVTIEPVGRSEFDVDADGNALSGNTEANLNGNELTVRRFDALVENGVEYKLTIPAGKLEDASGNVTEEDYTLTFKTLDTIAPKIVSVTKNVDLNTPLEITFNEDMNVYSGTTIAVEEKLSYGTQIINLTAKRGADRKTIVAEVPSNVLSSDTDYRLHQDSEHFTDGSYYYIWARDDGGNVYKADVDTVDGADENLTTFHTGDVSGPECAGIGISVYGTDCYQASIQDGKIIIPFKENILEGEDFEGIRLSYLPSMALWSNQTLREQIKKYSLTYTCTIEDDTLLLEPSLDTQLADLSSQMSYAVFIPEKSAQGRGGQLYPRGFRKRALSCGLHQYPNVLCETGGHTDRHPPLI